EKGSPQQGLGKRSALQEEPPSPPGRRRASAAVRSSLSSLSPTSPSSLSGVTRQSAQGGEGTVRCLKYPLVTPGLSRGEVCAPVSVLFRGELRRRAWRDWRVSLVRQRGLGRVGEGA